MTGTRRCPALDQAFVVVDMASWTLLVFASLAVVRLLPGGYTRAAVAAPILLMVPGSLTLGAVFNQRRRPQGAGVRLLRGCCLARCGQLSPRWLSTRTECSSRPKARTGACS